MIAKNELSENEKIALVELKPIMDQYDINPDIFESYDSDRIFENDILFAAAVLKEIGFEPSEIKPILYGYDESEVKCEIEYISGWNGIRSWNKCYYALKAYAEMVVGNDKRFEVGFKYASVTVKAFVKKFNLTFLGAMETPSSKKHRLAHDERNPEEKRKPLLNDVYKDPAGNIYTFGADGNDYSGFVFNDKETAFKFVKWYLNTTDRYVKDIETLFNRLGGLNKYNVDELGI